MNLKSFSVTLLFIGLIFGVHSVSAQNKTYLLPGTPFNAAEAQKALAKGSSAIRGVAYTKDTEGTKRLGKVIAKMGPKKFAYRGTTVTLFPLTPYFQEYLELRKKHGSKGKKVAVISNEAYKYRITTQVIDDKGYFQFTDLKPGKYLLEANITYVKSGTVSEQTGTETAYNVFGQELYSNPTYSSYSIAYDVTNFVYEYVEIVEDETILEVTLK